VIKLLWLAICTIEDKGARHRAKEAGLGRAPKRKAERCLVEGQVTTSSRKASESEWISDAPVAAGIRCWDSGRGICSQGRRSSEALFPHSPFNPCVRFSRTRLTDGLLGMVTQPSGSGL
jgi:hypothetical protein